MIDCYETSQNLAFSYEHTSRMFEKKVVKKNMPYNWKEVMTSVVNFQSFSDLIRVVKVGWDGHAARLGRKINMYRILVDKPRRRR